MRRPLGAVAALLTLAALLAGATGCEKKAPRAPRAETALFRTIAIAQNRADEIFAARDTMKVERGHWSGPGFTATYEARRSGDVLRFIEEQEDRGEYGSWDHRYYLDSTGVFFFYEDRGEEREPRGSLPPMSRLIQRTLLYASDGRLAWGRRLVDGVAGAVPDSQVVAIRERAASLVAAVSRMKP